MDYAASRHHLSSRFRLPGIDELGCAQLSVIETALYPLDRTNDATSFSTSYEYTDASRTRQRAVVQVGWAFEPLKANDDYYLWSLLSLTLRFSQNHVLTASPYWLLKQLGIPTSGGWQYEQLRQVVERLAQTVYHNTGFYNPVSQAHERWTFAFFSTRLPTSLDADRLWRIVWFDDFITASKATGGRLLFDLELFRKLGSPATRRLFLKLSDRFYRSNRVHLEIDDLTINGLGFAAERPLKKRKYDLVRCIETLLEHEVITLGRGQTSVKDLFIKRGVGRYVVVFYKGRYFEQPLTESGAKADVKHDPLFGPMQAIGVDEPMIGKLLAKCQRGMLERWLRIAEAAVKDKPAGFPGFKVSPAAFFVDGVLNERMPPDWMYQFEKSERQRVFAAEAAKEKASEKLLREDYQRQRRAALKAFLQAEAGRKLYQAAFDARLALNVAVGHPLEIARRQANDEALDWVEGTDEFAFPEFYVWTVAQQTAAK